MKLEIISKSVTDTENAGAALARSLKPGAVVAMYGDLGAGKTALCRGIVFALGSDDCASPTFTIVNEYEGRIPLFHFDLYRLEDADALFDIGWEDYLSRGGVCAVEWSERAPEALPPDTLWVTLERHPEHDGWRVITVGGGKSA